MPPSSVHYQRRWHYALWVTLLGISVVTLIGWETPKQAGFASLRLELELQGFPAMGTARAWVGPRSQWRGAAWDGTGAWADIPFSGGKLSFPPTSLPGAHRRWAGGFIPRKTADLLVVKFQSPGHPPRYLAVSLAADWHHGLLRIDRSFGLQVPLTWDGLWEDPSLLPLVQ